MFLESTYLVRTSEDYTKDYIILDIAKIVQDPTSESNILIQEYDELFFYLREILRTIMSYNFWRCSAPIFFFWEGITLSDILIMAGGLAEAGAKIDISRIVDYDAEINQINLKEL